MRDELRNRRENMWSGKESIVVATRVIELEEAQGNTRYSSPGEGSGSVRDRRGSGRGDHFTTGQSVHLRQPPTDIRVPLCQPPTMAKVFPLITDPMNGHCDEATTHALSTPRICKRAEDAKVQTVVPPSEGVDMLPPYGIVERRRIKNTLIEPRQSGGVWITMFRDLEDGQEHWHLEREFLVM